MTNNFLNGFILAATLAALAYSFSEYSKLPTVVLSVQAQDCLYVIDASGKPSTRFDCDNRPEKHHILWVE
jgi:hypothetical protein